MRVASICFSHSRGLGHLARSFFSNGIIDEVCRVRHPSIPMREDWYPESRTVNLRGMDRSIVHDFMREQDVMLFFETPFEWEFISFCKQHGIKTAIIPMYECTPARFATMPKDHPEVPDLWICPSLLDVDYFNHFNHTFIPIPVDMPWRLRERATHFIHNGGYLGLKGREGTVEVIEAMKYVKSDLRLTIRVQENVKDVPNDPRITYIAETVPFEELYSTGDVAVVPQRFNGMSLPLQEAFASGLLCMTTDRYPMNTWLPRAPMLPVEKVKRGRVGGSYMEMDICTLNPKTIAAEMDRWYDTDIAEYSMLGKKWAEETSWTKLKPLYMESLQHLVG